MEQPKPISSISMQNHVYDMTISRSGSRSDNKLHPPFQAIIEKGRQAKAQVEQDQYEARKAKRESEIKNAARIRHAEAEANRRRAEESKLSIDEYKEKLLDEMTTNIKTVLEDKYRKEVRAKVYENEDRIASAHEQDVKDKTEARLVKELESVVKAKLGAQFEPEVKQRLAVELVSVVKAELQAKHETEVRQQLVQDLGPAVEIELRAKYEIEVKQRLAEELQSEVKAELRAHYGEEIKNRLMDESESIIIHDQKGTQTDDENEPRRQRDILHTLEEEPFRPAPNDINTKGDEYPDLSHHQHLINRDGVQSGQQEARFVQTLETTIITDGDAVVLPRGTKRSLSGVDDEEKDVYARRSKRSRSASSDSEGQQLPSRNVEAVSNPYSSRLQIHESLQGVRHNGDDSQGLSHYEGDDGHEVAQGNNGYPLDRGNSGYNSSNEVQGSPENSTGYGSVDYHSAGDVQGMNGKFLVREWTNHDSIEYLQEINGDLSQHEEADFDSDEDVQEGTFLNPEGAGYNSIEDMQGTNGDFLSHEEADYDSAEDVRASNRYYKAVKTTESCNSEDGDREDDEEDDEDEDEDEDEGDYGEEYGSEEEEEYSTAPQAGSHSNGGNGVISFSNTQDTAFVLSDSEDEAEKAGDEDKTLVGNDGAGALIDAKHYGMPAEETLFLSA